MAEYADSPVPSRISHHGATVRGDQAGWGAALTFVVGEGAGGAATDLYPFLRHLGGTLETITTPTSSYERIVPLRHPFLPEMLLRTANATATGRGREDSPGWGTWKIECEFGTVPFQIGGSLGGVVPATAANGLYYTVQTDYGGEWDTIPLSAMKFSNGQELTGDAGRFFPEIAMSITTYLSPDPVTPMIAGLTGKVNSVPFFGFAAGYVRFDGVKTQFSQTITFATTYQKTFSLRFKSRKWNDAMRKDGVIDTPLNVDSGAKKYEEADLNPLLY